MPLPLLLSFYLIVYYILHFTMLTMSTLSTLSTSSTIWTMPLFSARSTLSTWVLKKSQEIPRNPKGPREISKYLIKRDIKGSQGISGDLKRSQGISRDLKEYQEISRDVKGNHEIVKWQILKNVKSAHLTHLLGPILELFSIHHTLTGLSLEIGMSHSQMLGKFEYRLPAKFWRLVRCTEMLSW